MSSALAKDVPVTLDWSRDGWASASLPAADQSDNHREEAQLAGRFAVLAKQLVDDAAGISAPRRLMRHPGYVEILTMGEAAVPLLLRRLETPGGRPVWLSLLGQITASPPGLGTDTIGDAAEAWVQWGRRSGYINR